ncbi:3-deoxy-7-phosphoheptulonate synthase [Patulibacter sp.]|uniref:3-deoxy-7-phosphoheptulonate synthase n=1 Tax=Patulibacter sp. TaxID=1912859 RepID=UPI00271D8AD2|nr:3-deoxy-7-phosphoheptulonate synthase [Patulibacter sp.]MDO9410661.1 3-deoxy-7-phosphoheptulonate synthase [Patulibacter sp.]
MMIVMKADATQEEIDTAISRVEEGGARAHVSTGAERTVIGAVGVDGTQRERLASLATAPGVDRVVPITKPYKLASREFGPDPESTLEIAGRTIGGGAFATIAGPCTVESYEQTMSTARTMRDVGVQFFRAGAYKPRSSPYSFQGLGREGLGILRAVKEETGLPIVTELMDVRDVEAVCEVADVIQVGARNMQNYPLLTEIGRSGVATLIKRGLAATIEELLMASEYVLKEGNPNVILCERGIRTFETTTRFTLDIAAVPVLKELTHLPVVVDPSHAAGRRDLVLPLSMAAAAAGADGIIVETHPAPEEAVCDGPQQLRADEFGAYLRRVEAAAALAGRVPAPVTVPA